MCSVVCHTVLGLAPLSNGVASPLSRPDLGDRELATETYSTIALIEDGTYIMLQLYFSNFGLGDNHAACRLLVASPNRPAWHDGAKVDSKGWHLESTGERALRVGSCKLVAEPFFEMQARMPSGFVRIRMDRPAEQRRPPNNRIALDDDFYEHEILVPWATAAVELQEAGAPARQASGFGYSDHSRAAVLPAALADTWIRFRGGDKSGDAALVWARFPPASRNALGYVWHAASSAPRPLSRVAHAKSADQLWSVSVTGPVGTWHVKSVRLFYRFAPMEEYGFLARLARPVIGNPVTYAYLATLEGDGISQEIRGVLEVSYDE